MPHLRPKAPRPRGERATTPSPFALTRRGFLALSLAAGAVGAWETKTPAAAASPVADAAASAARLPERPHRTLLGVL
ncbi:MULTISPECIES: hypothetical protein [Microbacterium]|jgi:hypothetical protein|uniref:Twin-arginine translocation signal domain-containing protein n=1 Tax=Microbacterium mcarthurae TaxID=3035918 RepID=A0ABW9GG38_9MICO